MTAVAQRLPWRASWSVVVTEHLERDARGGLERIRWPPNRHITASCYYNGRTWIAEIRPGDQMPVQTPCPTDREARRLVERFVLDWRARMT